MKPINYKGWLQLSANVAILTGVVLVIFQLRQNADTWQKMVEEPENLNLAELRAIESHLWAHDIVRWRNIYDLSRKGLLEEDAWKRTIREDLEFELAHPYGRAWWEEIREIPDLPRELVEFVDDGLAKAPHNVPIASFDRILENAKKKKELAQSEPGS